MNSGWPWEGPGQGKERGTEGHQEGAGGMESTCPAPMLTGGFMKACVSSSL